MKIRRYDVKPADAPHCSVRRQCFQVAIRASAFLLTGFLD
jgi:hypothetical protein